jgi:peptidoglycan hydrolase-like protein with peptidoglycan-binding domain
METLAYNYVFLAYAEESPVQFERKQSLRRSCFSTLSAILILGYLASPAQAILQIGDQGEGVVALQTFLAQQGYFQGKATGYYGEGTKTAVIRYQQAQGLTPDGIVGVATQQTSCQWTKQTSPPKLQPQPVRFVAQDRAIPNATPNTTPNENVILRVGSAGEEVKVIQRRLRELGYFAEEVTGYFGEVTREAVIKFQRDRGLTPDGLVGQSTLTTLLATNPTPPVVVSPQVRELQQRLKKAGFYQGEIDGIWGPQTQAAIEAAQQAFNIQPRDLQ